ncbi:MAG: ExbD/TolR family protein [Planctomycetota bacterium]
MSEAAPSSDLPARPPERAPAPLSLRGNKISLGGSSEAGSGNGGLNTTSMTDVIFILLIFFIAMSEIRAASVEVELPAVDNEAEQEASDQTPLVVEIAKDGEVSLEGTPVEDTEELVQRLRVYRQQQGDPIIRIRGDRDAKNGKVVEVIAGLASAGLNKIEIAVQKKR